MRIIILKVNSICKDIYLKLLNEPKVLMLDEPTDGLDPISRKKVLNSIKELAEKGNIILITSHLLSDLSLIADKVGIMDGGMLISEISCKKFLTNNKSTITFEFRNKDSVRY